MNDQQGKPQTAKDWEELKKAAEERLDKINEKFDNLTDKRSNLNKEQKEAIKKSHKERLEAVPLKLKMNNGAIDKLKEDAKKRMHLYTEKPKGTPGSAIHNKHNTIARGANTTNVDHKIEGDERVKWVKAVFDKTGVNTCIRTLCNKEKTPAEKDTCAKLFLKKMSNFHQRGTQLPKHVYNEAETTAAVTKIKDYFNPCADINAAREITLNCILSDPLPNDDTIAARMILAHCMKIRQPKPSNSSKDSGAPFGTPHFSEQRIVIKDDGKYYISKTNAKMMGAEDIKKLKNDKMQKLYAAHETEDAAREALAAYLNNKTKKPKKREGGHGKNGEWKTVDLTANDIRVVDKGDEQHEHWIKNYETVRETSQENQKANETGIANDSETY